jgi:hypothetical protein
MSIAPVSSIPPDLSESRAIPNSVPVRSSASLAAGTGNASSPPVSAPRPTREASVATKATSAYELPQDVVEVHQDPDIKDQLIVQYVNNSKDVVLQVPSAQELSVEHGIAQDIQQAAKQRASDNAATISEEDKTHGD